MKEPLVVAKGGPFELLERCHYENLSPNKDFCEHYAVKNYHGYPICEACYASIGIAESLYDLHTNEYYKTQYIGLSREGLRQALERLGPTMATKIGRADLYAEYVGDSNG